MIVQATAALTAIAVAALVWAERRDSTRGKWIAKPIASTGFVVAAASAGALDSRFGQALLVALALSWVGDLLLLGRSTAAFRAGLFTFLVGHVAFCIAFVLRGAALAPAALAAIVLLAAAVAISRWLLPHVPGPLRGPVVAYVVVISAMVSLAAGSAAQGAPRLLVAACAFFLSDLSVARDRFVAPGFVNRAWGLPLYYGAQLLFACSAG
jgi:uncharacterized membrane protein YhhN